MTPTQNTEWLLAVTFRKRTGHSSLKITNLHELCTGSVKHLLGHTLLLLFLLGCKWYWNYNCLLAVRVLRTLMAINRLTKLMYNISCSVKCMRCKSVSLSFLIPCYFYTLYLCLTGKCFTSSLFFVLHFIFCVQVNYECSGPYFTFL